MRSLCTEEDGQMKLHFFSCVSALLDATNKHGRLLIKGWGRGLGVPLQIFYDTFIFHQNVTNKHLGYASNKPKIGQRCAIWENFGKSFTNLENMLTNLKNLLKILDTMRH